MKDFDFLNLHFAVYIKNVEEITKTHIHVQTWCRQILV